MTHCRSLKIVLAQSGDNEVTIWRYIKTSLLRTKNNYKKKQNIKIIKEYIKPYTPAEKAAMIRFERADKIQFKKELDDIYGKNKRYVCYRGS